MKRFSSTMNVVFICVDCLREDFVSSDYAETPFLDKLVSEGIYFENMYSTTATTTPCVASFMTGCYSEKNGVNSHSYSELNEDLDTLAEIFKKEGYSTYAMPTGPLVTETGLDRGFDQYWYRDRQNHLFDEWGDIAREKSNDLHEPFFLYLHLWELHWPIEVPPEYDSKEYGGYSYSRVLSALDAELKSFIRDLPEDTAILFHGDHGESISGRGVPWAVPRYLYRKLIRNKFTYPREYDTRGFARIINRIAERISQPEIRDHYLETGHGDNIYDFTTNVPFLIHLPDVDSNNIEEQVRQIDIFPTVLDVADIEYDSNKKIDGKSLFPPSDISDRTVYMRAAGAEKRDGRGNSWMRGIRADGYKYVEYPNRDWSPEIYDLKSDPLELEPVSNKEIQEEMADKLPDEGLIDVDKNDVDDLLRDLGYL